MGSLNSSYFPHIIFHIVTISWTSGHAPDAEFPGRKCVSRCPASRKQTLPICRVSLSNELHAGRFWSAPAAESNRAAPGKGRWQEASGPQHPLIPIFSVHPAYNGARVFRGPYSPEGDNFRGPFPCPVHRAGHSLLFFPRGG